MQNYWIYDREFSNESISYTEIINKLKKHQAGCSVSDKLIGFKKVLALNSRNPAAEIQYIPDIPALNFSLQSGICNL